MSDIVSTPENYPATNSPIVLTEAVVLLGQFPALSGVNLKVGQGEIVAVTGANGAGKTTLLKLLAGLIGLTKGSGKVLGFDLAGGSLENLRCRVGLLGNKSMLYEDLSVLENLKFWSRLFGIDQASVNHSSSKKPSSNKKSLEEIETALNYLELNRDFWNLPVRVLSTGQKRRAALALQILKRPNLWLLDEPHSGLDKSGRDLLDNTLKRASKSGAAVILVSHEVERASGLADRNLELAGGRFK